MRIKGLCVGMAMALCLAFAGCGEKAGEENSNVISGEPIADAKQQAQSENDNAQAGGSEEAPASEAPGFDTAYIGEFVDEDGTDCTLEIAPGEEAGQYVVQLSIFRLTSFDDGVGVMTEEGLQFTATDAAEQPITAVITLDGENATVKFTDSKWDLIENGAEFVYKKTSEIPQLIQY